MKKWAILLLLGVASCTQQSPGAPPPVDAPQRAVGQAWRALSDRSLYSPRLDTMDQARVLTIFQAMVGQSPRGSMTLSFDRPEDFRAAVKGERFQELERLVARVDKPGDAPRWHVYGAWINAVARSFDERASYYPASRQAAVATMVSASEEGLGVELTSLPHGTLISALSPQGPASKAGVESGSRLLAVGESSQWTDASSLSAYEAQALLRGPPGSKVKLRLLDATGRERTFNLVRSHWSLDALRVRRQAVGRSEVITIPGFYLDVDPSGRWNVSTQSDVLVALKATAPQKPLVVDLRGNPGGVLEQAAEVAGLLGGQGSMWSIEGQHVRRPQVVARRRARKPDAVWVDENTGSSAEILAGAFQIMGVPVVGVPTFGKTTMQLMLPLDQAGLMRTGTSPTGNLLFTTARISWGGRDPQRVIPDCLIKGELAGNGDRRYYDTTVACALKTGYP